LNQLNMSGLESTKDPSYKVPERPHSSLTIYRNLAYNILKYLEDEIVKDKEIPELEPCSECTNNIQGLPLKAITILSCGHLFHRLCIEKKLMITRPDVCPLPDCGMKVDIIYPVSTSARRGSQSSQSSGTSALSNLMGEKFNLFSLILENPLEEVEDACLAEDNSKKRTSISTEESSSKKKKTSDKEGDSAMMKKLVKELKDDSINQELSSPTQSPEDSYTHLYKEIVKAETQNDSASQR
ncbi:7422_t:CDS:1, partial [Funneliformis geosporum]